MPGNNRQGWCMAKPLITVLPEARQKLIIVLPEARQKLKVQTSACAPGHILVGMRLGLHSAAAAAAAADIAAASPELLLQCPHALCELLTHCSQLGAHNIFTLRWVLKLLTGELVEHVT